AFAENRRDDIPKYLTDRWIADNTLSGPATRVRDRLGEGYAAGLNTPVLVPNSVNGNQLTALDQIFAAFAPGGTDGTKKFREVGPSRLGRRPGLQQFWRPHRSRSDAQGRPQGARHRHHVLRRGRYLW